MHKPRIFISHAWTHHDKYDGLVLLLENRKYFDFYNHSVPKEAPIVFENANELAEKIKNKMQGCQLVLILAGVYATNREWMKKEIEMAIEMGKPIIGIRPRAQHNLSTFVQTHADQIVNWNTESVVKAIREYI